MHCRKSGISWKTVSCLCIFNMLIAVSSAFAVDKTVKVMVSGSNSQGATVAQVTPHGLVKLLPAADGHLYVSTGGDKLSLSVDMPQVGVSNIDVALPDQSAVTVEVAMDSKVSARVLDAGKGSFRPVPAANSPNLTTVGGSVSLEAPAPTNNTLTAELATAGGQKAVPQVFEKGYSEEGIDPRGGPANDDCANAVAVGDGAFAFSTVGAVTDGPALPAGCEEGFGLAFGQDIWYCYTATCDGTATVALCGSAYDTRLAIYDGCGCPAGALVACNDDACGGALQSSASFAVVNGNSYLIRIGGFGTASGTGTCTISCTTGGGGGGGSGGSDACTGAEAIAGAGLYDFDTSAATTDGSPNSACLAFGTDQIENDVWFCWTSDCDGQVRIETCGLTAVDTRIAVYDDCGICPPTDAELIACNDDSCSLQSRVTFTATIGTQYLVRIGNYPGAGGGTGQFRIDCLPPAMEICTQPSANCQGRDVSDAFNSTGGIFHVAEDFTPAADGAVSEVCWWGTYSSGAASGPDGFEIRYYASAANIPGALIAGPFSQAGGSLTVSGPSATGNQIAGVVPEYAYTGTHAAVPVTAGECYWIEIRNNIGGQSWFWEISPPGNGRSVQDGTPPNGYSPADVVLTDLAVCLNVALGDPAACAPPPAGNDNCADCEPIAGPGVFAFDNSAASTDGPAHGLCLSFSEDQIENDVWFCWTADCDGIVNVSTCGLTGVDTRIAVYNGLTCPTDDSTIIACNDDSCGLQSTVGFTAVSGNSYLIRIGNYPGAAPGVGAFEIECLGEAPCTQPPANCHTRNVANAFNSTRGTFTAADDFSPAANGSVAGLCWWGTYFDGAGDCSGAGADSFQIRYFAHDGVNNIPGALLATFSQGGGTLTVSPRFPTGGTIAGVVPEYEYSATHAPFSVAAGTCYWIEITNLNAAGCSWFWEIGGGGNLRAVQDQTNNGYDAADALGGQDLAFCLDIALGDDSGCAPPPPDNDECADAEMIACGSTVNTDNSAATTDAGDPLFSCAFFGPQQGFGTLWYTFVATDTSALVSLCNSGSTDTLLAVYSGTCGNLTEIACSEDFCGATGLVSELCASNLTVGQTYYIQVGSFSAADTGPIELSVTCPCPPPPPGDFCDDAVGPLAVPSATAGTTVGTTIDAAPFCGTSISAPGVWYTVIGTGNTMTASTCGGTPYDSKLNVYCGPCNNLTCVGGNDDACGLQSTVTWCSQAGALYRILVQGFGGATGPFTLSLSDNGVACTATVLCASVGGCCVDGDCLVRTEDDCAALGGDYLGDETDCSLTGTTTVTYDGAPNVAIPDANAAGVSHVINVPDSFSIEDLNVGLNVTHTFVGDLCVTLTHNATSVNLILRMGDGLNDCHLESPFGCGENNLSGIMLDDEGATSIESACSANLTSPPNFIPQEALSAFDGQDAAGAWTLTVSDNAGQDTGTFNSWSLNFSSGGQSPCVQEECDTCPPGTTPIIDGAGNFSGWCASTSHPANVTINTVSVSGGIATITIEKNFNEQPGFGGLVPAILIDFVQVCPDSQTSSVINIANEQIDNNTGVDWRDFHWVLFDGQEAWFDVAASGFSVAPFGSRLFSGFALTGDLNKAKSLTAYNGIVPNGTTFAPGSGTAPLSTEVDLTLNDRASFTLKEYPTLDGQVRGGACCVGLSCSFLSADDCAAVGGQYKGDGVECTPTICLPENDECPNCTPIQTGVPVNGTTDGATGSDLTTCAFSDTIDVWHCWTADCAGPVTFSLCGSSFDTTLAVFSACPTAVGAGQLLCNDDSAACGAGSLQSQGTLAAVTPGATYYIRVSGFNGLTGNYTLSVTCGGPGSGGSGRRPIGAVQGVSRQ